MLVVLVEPCHGVVVTVVPKTHIASCSPLIVAASAAAADGDDDVVWSRPLRNTVRGSVALLFDLQLSQDSHTASTAQIPKTVPLSADMAARSFLFLLNEQVAQNHFPQTHNPLLQNASNTGNDNIDSRLSLAEQLDVANGSFLLMAEAGKLPGSMKSVLRSALKVIGFPAKLRSATATGGGHANPAPTSTTNAGVDDSHEDITIFEVLSQTAVPFVAADVANRLIQQFRGGSRRSLTPAKQSAFSFASFGQYVSNADCAVKRALVMSRGRSDAIGSGSAGSGSNGGGGAGVNDTSPVSWRENSNWTDRQSGENSAQKSRSVLIGIDCCRQFDSNVRAAEVRSSDCRVVNCTHVVAFVAAAVLIPKQTC